MSIFFIKKGEKVMSVSMYDSLIESKKKEFDEIAKDVSNFLREKKK